MPRRQRKRSYRSPLREQRATRTRESILAAARRELLANGYASTTIAQIARRSRVSVETIYKAFGGKPGLVQALYEQSLEGMGPRPAEQRSDATSAAATDPRALLRSWGTFVAEITPLVAPITLLMRAAAEHDPDVAALLERAHTQRRARMHQNATRLAEHGWLRAGVSVDQAADILWTHTAPELYELLVIRRGWTPEQLGTFVADSMIGTLL